MFTLSHPVVYKNLVRYFLSLLSIQEWLSVEDQFHNPCVQESLLLSTRPFIYVQVLNCFLVV